MRMWKREGDADQIIERKALKQISDASVIEASVDPSSPRTRPK